MKRLETKKILIDVIQIGERFREDYGDVESLAQSIKSEGLINPITVDTESNLLAGGRRLEACKLLGWDSIDATIFKIENEYELRIVELIENIQRKEMTWAEQANLVKRINDLMKSEDIQWTQKQTASLLSMSPGHVSDQLSIADVVDQVPALAEIGSLHDAVKTYRALCVSMAESELSERLQAKAEASHRAEQGAEDEHQVDPHTAFVQKCASSYRIEDCIEGINNLPESARFDFVEIDPPYDANFDYKYDITKLEIYGDRTYSEFMREVIEASYQRMQANSFMICWFPTREYTMFHETLYKVFGQKQVDPIPAIWYKETQPAGDIERMLARRYESFFVAWKGKPVLQLKGLPNIFEYNTGPSSARWHPVQRPIDMMVRLHEIFCPSYGQTLIPFAGSGTPINAHYLRNSAPNSCIGFDLNKEFRTRFLANLTYPTSK